MLNRKKGIEKFPLVLILLLMSLLVITATIFGGESDKKIEGEAKGKADFILTIKDDLISLNAKDASLKKIMEEIGSSMKIDVIGNIPEEEKISVGFDKLSLKELLEKLSLNYCCLMDSGKEEKRITKIIILPTGKKTSPFSLKTKQVAIQETKTSETQKAKESEIKERESKKTKRPGPFIFGPDPSRFMK